MTDISPRTPCSNRSACERVPLIGTKATADFHQGAQPPCCNQTPYTWPQPKSCQHQPKRSCPAGAIHTWFERQWRPSGINRIYRLYREEGLTVRKRKARRKAVGTRAPILVEARPNARWSLDFVHDQFANGQRFRVLNVVDDVTRECLAAIPDTSISGRRVARELTALIERRGKPGMIVS
jgi:hypothetical protein